MVLASFDFGVTWDEKARHRYGELIWEFYQGFAADRRSQKPAASFTGDFSTLVRGHGSVIPANRYVIRHVINATSGG